MANQLSAATINGILPKIIEATRSLAVAQCIFLKEIQKAKEKNQINPGGLYSNYLTLENDTAFGVAEGGPILGGGAPEYTQGSINIRAHWQSIQWTGSVERIRNNLLEVQRDPRFKGYTASGLMAVAKNFAVKDTILSALKMFAARENGFALNGTDKSPIGVITGLPGGTTVQFSWDTTVQGNRKFNKNQQIELRAPDGTLRSGGLAAGYSTVSTMVDKTPASGATGPVVFDAIPNNLQVGDTAHFRNSYGLMPTGVLHYVDDTTAFKGIAVATNPAIFASVVNRLVGSPTIAPLYVRELISLMQSKVGYEIPLDLVFWMNKTQLFNWQTQVFNSPFYRQLGTDKVDKLDMSVGEMYWDGKKFMIDPDVGPSHFHALNMGDWEQLVQTPFQTYEFDSGNLVINPIDSSGNRLEARMSTVFKEYNWDLIDRRGQGRIEGFAFDRRHI